MSALAPGAHKIAVLRHACPGAAHRRAQQAGQV